MTRIAPLAVLVAALAGCAAAPAPVVTSAPAPVVTPSPQRQVSFAAEDGVPLRGRVHGHGTVAVVLTNMGDNDPGPWDAFAPELSGRGYLVLTFSFRYPLRTDSFTPAMAAGTVPDLRGAVAYVRSLGATRVVLVGASLGGMTVGKIAGAVGAAAEVILSAEPDLAGYDFAVGPAELDAMAGPKLFIASQDDPIVGYAGTRTYFDRAPEPKRFHGVAGADHGVRIFAGTRGAEVRALLIDFIASNVPA
jgi:fermentation-respiration switch protein FrsA (DUF1100 family)